VPADQIIVGMDALQAKLRELDRTMQRDLLIEAAQAGAEIVRHAAAANAPRDTGELAENMTTRVSTSLSDSREGSVDVGPDRDEWYGFFVEFGTAFMMPRPFLRPALENNENQIIRVMQDVLLTAIEKVAE